MHNDVAGIRWRRRVAAGVTVVALAFAPTASAAPVEEVCPNGRAPRAGVCPDSNTGAPGSFPGGGGSGGGGLIDTIRDIVGGLTGGLL